MKISIVDDHKIFTELTSELLINNNIEVIDVFKDGDEVLKSETLDLIDILILDISLPKVNGLEVAEELIKSNIDFKIIILTSNTNTNLIIDLFRIGVHGYVPKTKGYNELLSAIKSVYKGVKYFSDLSISDLLNNYNNSFLELNISERESEIIKHLLEGKSINRIAEKLFISSSTVRTHKQNIFKKFNIKSLDELYRVAITKRLF